METIILDGEQMLSRRQAHDHIAERLQFPDCYGRNLDGLYDLLTERREPVQLAVRHKGTILSRLGAYGEALCRTLEDAARANPRLKVLFQEE